MAYHRIGKDGNRYWGKKGAGIFFTDGENVLLLKRSNKGDHAGTWGIPGGKGEQGETAIGNAMRESKEECGQVKGKRFDSLEAIDGHHRWTTFFFKVDKPFRCKLSNEHTDWKWVNFNKVESYNLHPKFKSEWPRYRKLLEKKNHHFSFKEFFYNMHSSGK